MLNGETATRIYMVVVSQRQKEPETVREKKKIYYVLNGCNALSTLPLKVVSPVFPLSKSTQLPRLHT